MSDINKTIEEARNTLYRIDGPIASPEAMIIENALTAIEAFISQQAEEIETLKLALKASHNTGIALSEEIERLRQALDMIEIHNGTIDAFKEIEKILKGVHPHVNP